MVAPRGPRFNAMVARASDRLGDRVRAVARPWEVALFAWVPLVVLTAVFAAALRWHNSLGDWEIFRAAALAIVHGRSPFVAVDPAALAHNDKFVYPPITALGLAPLALLPDVVGRILVLLLAVGCVLLALRLLGVSDWRCYGLALATAPVVDTVTLGALSSLLLLGAAVAWRDRDRPLAGGATVAATAVAKLFAWPLAVWLLATRRVRSALAAGALAVVLVVAGWAAIGFAGITGYPHLLRVLSRVEAVQSYSLAGLLRLTGPAAAALTVALAALVVAAVVLSARGADGDRRAFSVAVAGALLVTPVLWLHYLVLLFVPIALYRPRLSGLWFAPLAFWATPVAHSDGSTWKTAFALVVSAAITLGATSPRAETRRGVARLAPGAATASGRAA
jgi:alpha-1,2-mannosyltransferase